MVVVGFVVELLGIVSRFVLLVMVVDIDESVLVLSHCHC